MFWKKSKNKSDNSDQKKGDVSSENKAASQGKSVADAKKTVRSSVKPPAADKTQKKSQGRKKTAPKSKRGRKADDHWITITPELKKKFEKMTDRSGKHWYWKGSFTVDGYGQIWVGNNKVVKVHRLAYEIYRGPLEKRKRLRNQCGDDKCVNPDHWEIIIRNVYVPKGRAHLKGQENGRSRLSDADVKKIKKNAGKKTQKELAEEFGISASQVGRIIHGKAWSHVKP